MIDRTKFIFEETSTGFSAYSLEFQGVGVAAESREAAEQMLIEAIALHLEDEGPATVFVFGFESLAPINMAVSVGIGMSITSSPFANYVPYSTTARFESDETVKFANVA
jgi:hypothetical protein